MNRLLQLSVLATTALAATTAMAGITFFEAENFGGRQVTAERALANFPSVNFNDRAKSAIVEGGAWEVCVDINYSGGCTTLAPGRYPSLGAWTNLISSTRPLAVPVAAAQPAASTSGGVTFYGNKDFRGRRFTIDQSVDSFEGTRANDRAESAVVEGGAWEFCDDAGYRGTCQVFGPGRYPSLGTLEGRVSSARPYHDRQDRRGERRGEGRHGHATATLYANPNLRGRAFPLGNEGDANLHGQFNDRASSLRVDAGYWIFCSDAGFRGECRTFGPGEYAHLPPELQNRISSGRRISQEYPHGGRADRR